MQDFKFKRVFEENTPQERMQLLADNCEGQEYLELRRDFEPEEIADMKEKQVSLAIDLLEQAEKKREFMEEYNETTKPLKSEQRELLDKIKCGFVDENQNLYKMANHGEGVMEYYNANGQCVFQRTLHPKERQARMFTIPKTGTDNE